MVYKQLQKLFTKHGWSDMMDYTSRAYGMLLHATSARKKEVEQHYIRNIIKEVSVICVWAWEKGALGSNFNFEKKKLH